jgi:RNA polymerase sigma-70 factor (ECF subfamily)
MEATLDAPGSPLVVADSRAAHLVAAARGGDRSAFAELVEPELARALGAARLLCRSRDDAADAVQDALLSAWRGLHGLRDPAAFGAWFRRHVVRAAMRMRPQPGPLSIDRVEDIAGSDLDQALELRLLGRAFAKLSEKDRLVLTLHHFWRLPVAETAAALGIPDGTVKSRVHHALDRLRAAYDAEARR